MNAVFSATHYFHYVVKRLYQKIYAQFPIKIILAQAYMKIKGAQEKYVKDGKI